MPNSLAFLRQARSYFLICDLPCRTPRSVRAFNSTGRPLGAGVQTGRHIGNMDPGRAVLAGRHHAFVTASYSSSTSSSRTFPTRSRDTKILTSWRLARRNSVVRGLLPTRIPGSEPVPWQALR